MTTALDNMNPYYDEKSEVVLSKCWHPCSAALYVFGTRWYPSAAEAEQARRDENDYGVEEVCKELAEVEIKEEVVRPPPELPEITFRIDRTRSMLRPAASRASSVGEWETLSVGEFNRAPLDSEEE